jgi:hypothetical protein
MPIERGRPVAAPAPTRIIQRDGLVSFERAVERFSESHTSPKNGRPYSRTSRANIRGNLLGAPLRMFREQHGVTYIDEWTARVPSAVYGPARSDQAPCVSERPIWWGPPRVQVAALAATAHGSKLHAVVGKNGVTLIGRPCGPDCWPAPS